MSKNSRRESKREMEQIQRGLEAFLEQELQGMQGKKSKPQLYNLREEEIDNRRDTEDWDSPEHRRRTKAYRTQKRQDNHRETYSEKPNMRQRKQPIEELPEQRRKSKKKNNSKAESDRPNKRKKKRGSRFKRFLLTIVLLLAILAGGLYYVVGNVYGKLNYHEVESLVSEPMEDEEILNVLLIGNDSRTNGEDGRSDAMILVSVNSNTKKIYMTSLLRDMYVEIPGYKNNRLNAAYSFGGAELLMETIEQNFDIEVNRYVQVNFEAFANLVDAVGGVELELTSEEIEYVNGYLVEYNMLTNRPQGTDNMDTSVSGLVHLNGPQALAYSRNRYLGTDFGRTERQRKVLEAVIKKLPMALVTNPKELFDGLMPNLTTNLTQNECYGLSLTAAKYLGYDIVQSSIPLEGTYKNATIRDMAVLEVDFEANKQYLQDTVCAKELPVNP